MVAGTAPPLAPVNGDVSVSHCAEDMVGVDSDVNLTTQGPPAARGAAMAIGPIQLIALGFPSPNLHSEIIAHLEKAPATAS